MIWKAVCFDLQGTFVDIRSSKRESLLEMIDFYLSRWSEKDGIPLEQRLDPLLAALTRVPSRSKLGKISVPEYRMQKVTRVLDSMGIPVTQSFVERFIKQWSQHQWDRIVAYPEANSVLNSIGQRMKLAIITNTRKEQAEKMLLPFSKEPWVSRCPLIVSDGSERPKPHPDLFQKALKELKVDPSQALYIGNSYAIDVRGAERAGLQPIWFNPNKRSAPKGRSDKSITQWKELLPFIDKK
jgi:putative hydrolase of the HAD superfamily